MATDIPAVPAAAGEYPLPAAAAAAAAAGLPQLPFFGLLKRPSHL